MSDWLHDNVETWNSDDCSIYIKSTEGNVIKTLFEVYRKQNITTTKLEFTPKGIFNQQKNQKDDMLFDLKLYRDEFEIYKYDVDKKSHWVGLNSQDVASFFHNVKKKEAIEMGVPIKSPDNHLLGVIPLEGMSSRLMSGYIRDQRVQQDKIEPPVGYGHPVLIKGAEFQKSVKDMTRTTTNSTREVVVKGGDRWVSFWGDAKGVQGSSIIFGTKTDKSETLVRQTYDCASFASIAKAGTMCGQSKIKLYVAKDMPLKIVFPVGRLGTQDVYIKSHELIQKEKEVEDQDESDEESDEESDAESDAESDTGGESEGSEGSESD
jgi:hypothetical protein